MNEIVNASKKAAIKFEKIYKATTETNEVIVPKISASLLVNFPVGIGLRHVLDMIESTSASYQQFKAPAAPEPRATAMIENVAYK